MRDIFNTLLDKYLVKLQLELIMLARPARSIKCILYIRSILVVSMQAIEDLT